MIKIIKLTIFFIASISANAAEKDRDWQLACGNISSLSEKIMMAHQSGFPMKNIVEIVQRVAKEKHFDDRELKWTMSLAIEAYDTPRYLSEERQDAAGAEFRDKQYLKCIKVFL